MEWLKAYLTAFTGIVFIGMFAGTIMPSSSFAKYIRAFIGLLTVIVMLKPVLNFDLRGINLNVFNEVDAFAQVQIKDGADMYLKRLSAEFEDRIKHKITTALYENRIMVNSIEVEVKKDYSLSLIILSINGDINRAKKILCQDLGLDENIIEFK